MRALRISLTAPAKATSTAPNKKYFSTSALFRSSHYLEVFEQIQRLRLRFRLSGSCTPRAQDPDKTKSWFVSMRLRDVLAKRRANAHKCVVDVLRKGLHRHHRGEGNQSQDQCVFHQALPGFIAM